VHVDTSKHWASVDLRYGEPSPKRCNRAVPRVRRRRERNAQCLPCLIGFAARNRPNERAARLGDVLKVLNVCSSNLASPASAALPPDEKHCAIANPANIITYQVAHAK
jgi:hypothetical protein